MKIFLLVSFLFVENLFHPPPIVAHHPEGEEHLTTPGATITVPLNEDIFRDKERAVLERKERANKIPPLLLIIIGILVVAGVSATVLAERQHRKRSQEPPMPQREV